MCLRYHIFCAQNGVSPCHLSAYHTHLLSFYFLLCITSLFQPNYQSNNNNIFVFFQVLSDNIGFISIYYYSLHNLFFYKEQRQLGAGISCGLKIVPPKQHITSCW